MIRVDKNFANLPSGLRSAKAKAKVAALLREKNKHRFSAGYYRHVTVLARLKAIYNGKCAFCEANTSHGAAPQVEHYRPKKHLKDQKDHPGYYWLAYEWSNLLLACSACNTRKSNAFPIMGHRVESHPENNKDWIADGALLQNEEPLLLHPEIDEPVGHLSFMPNGHILARNGSLRGQTTISICGLDREDLVLERKRTVKELQKWLMMILNIIVSAHKNRTNGPTEDEVDLLRQFVAHVAEKARNTKANFSAMFREVLADPEKWLCEELPTPFKSVVARAFLKYR